MGEPAGIGGEIALKSWADKRATPCFFIIDDIDRLRSIATTLDLEVPVEPIESAAEAAAVFKRALPVLHHPLTVPSRPGLLDEAHAKAVCAAIEKAVALVRGGEASAVVTNPIHKGSLYAAGFTYPGHTEYLASLAGSKTAPVMMLASSQLRVVLVTIHISLARMLEELNTESIRKTAELTARALKRDFGIDRPRLAIAGLNPHAGEDGAMGDEEIRIIAPAIAALRNAGLDVSGPYPPDTMFTPRARSTYDAAICMYHDQALIPLKTLDFDDGVNITLGLPFVRTSPDHGTALDIAGTGRADPGSLIEAINLAADMAKRRAAFGNS
ncbi:MAG: 4-hydroxythreonine-4-phosphate dehydrogenase PdxA [Rhodospirillales bacterium]|nr:4-hydroxythreonine-4-phosphate dehydrogenase PdxA [Rhodospirillales bacterium]